MSYLRSDGTSDPEVVGATLYRYALPLAQPLPLRSGATASERRGWIVILFGQDGATGAGEIAPLVFDESALTAIESDLIEALEHARAGRAPKSDEPLHPAVLFGVSAALADLGAASSGVHFHRHLSADAKDTVAVNMLVDGGDPERLISRGLAAGFRCFKVKVGRLSVDEDVDRVNRIHDYILGRASLRLDANRAWTMAEACRFADGIADVALDYIEEPLDEYARLEELYYRTGWPLALDESVVELASTNRYEQIFRQRSFLAAVVLKPSQLGDIHSVLSMAEQLGRAELRVTVSSSLESAVGRRTLLALAATPAMCHEPAGLATGHLFAADLFDGAWSDTPTVDVNAIMSRPVEVVHDLLTVVKQW